jgi:O-acetyl-ADP-ribose deacetylase (regulator of RNase III)
MMPRHPRPSTTRRMHRRAASVVPAAFDEKYGDSGPELSSNEHAVWCSRVIFAALQKFVRYPGRMGNLEVVHGDLTRLAVDAIVNAANEAMLGGGGVDGAIHRAAGPELLEECRKAPQVRPGVRCPTGEARITPGFRLPARYVIHTVGPVWRGGARGEPDLLAACYRNVLALAAEHGLASVAFPAISCGVYGYPLDEAAAIAVREVRASLSKNVGFERVVLCAFEDDVARAFHAALAALA